MTGQRLRVGSASIAGLCALVLLVFTATNSALADNARVIHKERSLYSTVLVTRDGSLTCLAFSVKRDQRRQTCRDERNPDRLVFSYTRMMLSSLLFNPDPKRILVLGLGGGSLPGVLSELYPDSKIDAVELDPAVVQVAREYFGYKPHPGTRVAIADARLFVKRQRGKALYDLVLLDAFDGEYIPEHLMTREFLDEVKSVMAPNGILAANTFTESELYQSESATYAAVFGSFYNFQRPETGNRVVLASAQPLPAIAEVAERVQALDARLARYGVSLADYVHHIDGDRDWRPDARVLTDQYSPANLLR